MHSGSAPAGIGTAQGSFTQLGCRLQQHLWRDPLLQIDVVLIKQGSSQPKASLTPHMVQLCSRHSNRPQHLEFQCKAAAIGTLRQSCHSIAHSIHGIPIP